MLLHLVKHLQPDIVNMTKEVSKANNGANSAAFKGLLCVIKHILDTKKPGLKIELTGDANEP